MKINKFITFLSIILCFIICTFYIWFKFIRERLPRDIPFNLNILMFIFLCVICISYFIAIINCIIIPQTPNKYILKFYQKLQFILIFFDNVDTSLKKNNIVNKVINNIITKIIIIFKLYDTTNNEYFYYVFNLTPRIILSLLFCFDVFYTKRLENFYNFLSISLIPLLYNYMVFSISKVNEIEIQGLEKKFKIEMLSTKKDEDEDISPYNKSGRFFCFMYNLDYDEDNLLDLRYFINLQALNIIYDYDLYKYTCVETSEAREAYAEKHNIELPYFRIFEPRSDYISEALYLEFISNIENIIINKAFIEIHKDITQPYIKKRYVKYIIICYFCCWLYILNFSLYNAENFDLIRLLETFQNDIEPFSDEPFNE